MPLPPTSVPTRSAVLSMDYQSDIVSIYAKDQELVARAGRVLKHTRSAGMLVIHVKVGFRPNLPEISSRNLLLSAIKTSPKHQQVHACLIDRVFPRQATVLSAAEFLNA